MLRILLIILVALAVIIGLMKLTGTRPETIGAPAGSGVENVGEAVGNADAANSGNAEEAAPAEGSSEAPTDVYEDAASTIDAAGEASPNAMDSSLDDAGAAADASGEVIDAEEEAAESPPN